MMRRHFVRMTMLTLGLTFAAGSSPFAQAAPLDARSVSTSEPSEKSKKRLAASRPLTDWELATCVRTAFWEDKELAPLNLHVSVEQGVATVDGPVPSEYLRRKALSILQTMRGIRGVRDHVRVHSPNLAAVPQERHTPPVDQPWPKKSEPIQPVEMPLKAPPAEKPLTGLLNRDRTPANEETPRSLPDDWRPATGQGYWLPSNTVRAGLLPPVSGHFGPSGGQPDNPAKVGLGQPVPKRP